MRMHFDLKTIKEISIIIVLATCSAFLSNAFSDHAFKLSYKPVKLEQGTFLVAEDALQLFRRREAIFIDSRRESEYALGHIKGAINIPFNTSRIQKMKLLQKISKEKNIIVYCGTASCKTAERLAGEMSFLGFQNVTILADGFENWPAEFSSMKDAK